MELNSTTKFFINKRQYLNIMKNLIRNRDTMFWNEKAECMSKEEKEELQLKRLQETVKLAYENVEFY